MDCSLIENCIWGTEKQQKKAKEIVEKCIKQNGLDCDTAIEDIQEQIEEFVTSQFTFDVVAEIDGIKRIRLGSLEPDHISDEMLTRLSQQEKFCPQFHLSLQLIYI